jgi:glycosyltransferase involved in cell wall biosynthesis
MRVLVVAPVPPPYGGMALQAQQLETLLRGDGVEVSTLASNFALPSAFRLLDRVPGVRTCLRAGLVWFKLWAHVRDVDVVHILAASWLYFFVAVYPAVLVGRARRKRVVLNYRGGEARDFFRRYGWLAAPAFKLADAITVPSEFLAAVIRERFAVPVVIVPNILDSSLFSYRQRTVVRPALLVTRHLEKIYDVESVLKAFRAVRERHPDASLWVAGSGAEAGHLHSLVAAWSLDHVRFLGHVAHRDLPAIYDQCDIYVNASLVDNFPGALVEASAAGLVVVTTRAGGIPFIYEHGRTAMLVEPGDWQGLAAAVEHVLEDHSAALSMTRAAVAIARACDWPQVRKRLFEAYGFPVETDSSSRASLDGARCAAG